jgi:hypothetical protein
MKAVVIREGHGPRLCKTRETGAQVLTRFGEIEKGGRGVTVPGTRRRTRKSTSCPDPLYTDANLEDTDFDKDERAHSLTWEMKLSCCTVFIGSFSGSAGCKIKGWWG